MNHRNYPTFFSSVTKLFTESPDFFRLFQIHGLSANDWPECDGRALAVEFEEKAREKSIEVAKVLLRPRAATLPNYTGPTEFDEFLALYDQYRAFGVWSDVSRRIAMNPLKGPEIVSQVKTRSAVNTIYLQERLESFIKEKLTEAKENKTKKVIIPGWEKLSGAIGGFNPGRISLLVAGTGVGKTTFALNLLVSAIKAKNSPVLFVNMEMIPDDILERIVSISADVNGRWAEAFNESVSDQIFKSYSNLLASSAMFLTDGRAMAIDEISGVIARHADQHEIKLVVVDYDQKIISDNRDDEWRSIQRSIERLEEIAKATNTAIIVLAQGDENGLPKASKRSMQPCSSVLYLSTEGPFHYIESKKNRFGERFKLKLSVDFSKFQIKENDFESLQKLAEIPNVNNVFGGPPMPGRRRR